MFCGGEADDARLFVVVEGVAGATSDDSEAEVEDAADMLRRRCRSARSCSWRTCCEHSSTGTRGSDVVARMSFWVEFEG